MQPDLITPGPERPKRSVTSIWQRIGVVWLVLWIIKSLEVTALPLWRGESLDLLDVLLKPVLYATAMTLIMVPVFFVLLALGGAVMLAYRKWTPQG